MRTPAPAGEPRRTPEKRETTMSKMMPLLAWLLMAFAVGVGSAD